MNFKARGPSLQATEHGSGQASSPRPTPDSLTPRLDAEGTWLVVPLGRPHVVSGWSLVGARARDATVVAWRFIRKGELAQSRDAREWLKERLRVRFEGRADVPCFMTARHLEHFEEASSEVQGIRVRVVVTVGLSNALSAGDAPGPVAKVGTINVLVVADRPVSQEARLEALSVATEAKSLALFEAGVKSCLVRGAGRPATGTGTDCALVAAPLQGPGLETLGIIIAAGKHTAFGSAVGAATLSAVGRGVRRWIGKDSGGNGA